MTRSSRLIAFLAVAVLSGCQASNPPSDGNGPTQEAGMGDGAGACLERPLGIDGMATACLACGQLAGVWMLRLSEGGMVFMQFKPDGRWSIAPTMAELNSSTTMGTYRFSGTQLILRDVAAFDAGTTCGSTEEGTYVMNTVTNSCANIQLRLVQDSCSSRASSLDYASLSQ